MTHDGRPRAHPSTSASLPHHSGGSMPCGIQARNSTRVRDFQLPYTSHRRIQARRAAHERRGRNATGLDRLRHRPTIPAV
ncbi:hypothetical protein [Streptomyces sp. PT19]|uniref:hypothetical protein n=1 Tax=Streptomyces sp. PT19 TaxID=3452239 RepID=UPI003F81D349